MKRINYTGAHFALLQKIVNYAFDAANIGITSSIAAFLAVMTVLRDKTTAIANLYTQRGQIEMNIAAQKKINRADLAPLSFSIMSAVRAFALDKNMQDLAKSMKVSLGSLSAMPYPQLIKKVGPAIEIITPMVPDLVAYNINDATINLWKAKLQALSAIVDGPESAISLRKGINQQIQVAIRDAVSFLKNNCNATASLFLQANPAFYTNYKANLKLKITGIRHTSFISQLVNDIGEPFIQQTVTVDAFTKNGKSFPAISSTTDLNGNISIVEFEPGARTVTVSGDKVQTKTFGPYQFGNGKAYNVSQLVCQPSIPNNQPVKSASPKVLVQK
jgi:hypothetical protein